MLGQTLIGRRHSIGDAEWTMKLALSALRKGDHRLASSRVITAIIMASIASVGASPGVIRRAERIVLEGRRIIQSLVLSRVRSLKIL